MLGDSKTQQSAWWKVVINWVCGIEKTVELTAQQKAQQTSVDEVSFIRTLCNINALVLMAFAVFVCAFFAWLHFTVTTST